MYVYVHEYVNVVLYMSMSVYMFMTRTCMFNTTFILIIISLSDSYLLHVCIYIDTKPESVVENSWRKCAQQGYMELLLAVPLTSRISIVACSDFGALYQRDREPTKTAR